MMASGHYEWHSTRRVIKSQSCNFHQVMHGQFQKERSKSMHDTCVTVGKTSKHLNCVRDLAAAPCDKHLQDAMKIMASMAEWLFHCKSAVNEVACWRRQPI